MCCDKPASALDNPNRRDVRRRRQPEILPAPDCRATLGQPSAFVHLPPAGYRDTMPQNGDQQRTLHSSRNALAPGPFMTGTGSALCQSRPRRPIRQGLGRPLPHPVRQSGTPASGSRRPWGGTGPISLTLELSRWPSASRSATPAASLVTVALPPNPTPKARPASAKWTGTAVAPHPVRR